MSALRDCDGWPCGSFTLNAGTCGGLMHGCVHGQAVHGG
jgi:hypothetical protein